MKSASAILFLVLVSAQISFAQSEPTLNNAIVDSPSTLMAAASAPLYVILGASAREQGLIHSEIDAIQPAVLPIRIVFVPHWKYVDNARLFQLHVPKGYSSTMFTHLPSRTTFIDAERYTGDEYLFHHFAHELGHLASNSPKEDDAERIAKE